MSVPKLLSFVALGAVLAGCTGGEPSQQTTTGSSATSTGSTASTTAAGGGEHVAIPRTRVSLRVPEGLRVEPSLPGFGRADSRTSVVVVEQPLNGKPPKDALAEIASGFRAPSSQGLEFGEVTDATVAGFPAKSATGTQKVAQGTFAKAVVVLAADDAVVIMTATIEPGDPLSATDLLTVLTDAKWNTTAAPGDLGIDLTPAPGYQRLPGGTSGILFSLNGATGVGVPKLVVAPSVGDNQIRVDRHQGFAEDRFASLPPKPTVESTTKVEIAGLPGIELVGKGSRAGEAVYLVVVFTANGYIAIVGDYDPTKHADQLPAFRAMARSLVIK